jgi:toxin-antitoxin system PIN domain toxin
VSPSLLDVNVLVALIDPVHIHFHAAHQWLASHGNHKWATSPITANGCIRILCRPGYSNSFLPPGEAARHLRSLCERTNHEFWPDDISLLDESRLHLSKLGGAKQITDVYLLALAVAHRGYLVTFDRSIPWRAVAGATQAHLKILGG